MRMSSFFLKRDSGDIAKIKCHHLLLFGSRPDSPYTKPLVEIMLEAVE